MDPQEIEIRFKPEEKRFLSGYPKRKKKELNNWIPLTPYAEELPFFNVAGVYVIYVLGKVAYVGQSGNLHIRLRKHGFGQPILVVSDFFRMNNLSLAIGLKIRAEKYEGERHLLEKKLIKKLKPIASGSVDETSLSL